MDLTQNFSRVAVVRGPLYQKLLSLRPQMVQAVQKVYDRWQQNEKGFDEVHGECGICRYITEAMMEVIFEHVPEATVCFHGPHKVHHMWAVAYLNEESYIVDIPASVYETGDCQKWTKIKGVKFSPENITISFVNLVNIRPKLEDCW